MSYTTYDFSETLDGLGIGRAQVKKVVAAWGNSEEGCCEACGAEWSGGFLLEMHSGEFQYISGWCDYTGWGCQDGTSVQRFDARPNLKELANAEWEEHPADCNKFIQTGEGKWE